MPAEQLVIDAGAAVPVGLSAGLPLLAHLTSVLSRSSEMHCKGDEATGD